MDRLRKSGINFTLIFLNRSQSILSRDAIKNWDMIISPWPKLFHAYIGNFCVHARSIRKCKCCLFIDAFVTNLGSQTGFLFRPLLATSTLCIVRTLLDQKSSDDLQILGCLLLVDFLDGQVISVAHTNLDLIYFLGTCHLLIFKLNVYIGWQHTYVQFRRHDTETMQNCSRTKGRWQRDPPSICCTPISRFNGKTIYCLIVLMRKARLSYICQSRLIFYNCVKPGIIMSNKRTNYHFHLLYNFTCFINMNFCTSTICFQGFQQIRDIII